MFDYRWSRHRFYAARAGGRSWFEPGRVLGELGLEDTATGRRQYAERMRQRALDEIEGNNTAEAATLRRGWCLGRAGFRECMLSLLERTGEKIALRRPLDAVVRRSHWEGEAERLLHRGLARFRIEAGELKSLRCNDARKVALATLIRTRTSVPNKWIAQQLSLGHASSISRYMSDGTATELEKALLQ